MTFSATGAPTSQPLESSQLVGPRLQRRTAPARMTSSTPGTVRRIGRVVEMVVVLVIGILRDQNEGGRPFASGRLGCLGPRCGSGGMGDRHRARRNIGKPAIGVAGGCDLGGGADDRRGLL